MKLKTAIIILKEFYTDLFIFKFLRIIWKSNTKFVKIWNNMSFEKCHEIRAVKRSDFSVKKSSSKKVAEWLKYSQNYHICI